MKLHDPFIITARLLPGVKVGDGYISIEYGGTTDDNRTRYRYQIDTPEIEHTDNDLKSGGGGGSLQEGMASLLSFLDAAAESYDYHLRTGSAGENEDLFPKNVVEWAYQNRDEIGLPQCVIEETPNLIEETQ